MMNNAQIDMFFLEIKQMQEVSQSPLQTRRTWTKIPFNPKGFHGHMLGLRNLCSRIPVINLANYTPAN